MYSVFLEVSYQLCIKEKLYRIALTYKCVRFCYRSHDRNTQASCQRWWARCLWLAADGARIANSPAGKSRIIIILPSGSFQPTCNWNLAKGNFYFVGTNPAHTPTTVTPIHHQWPTTHRVMTREVPGKIKLSFNP